LMSQDSSVFGIHSEERVSSVIHFFFFVNGVQAFFAVEKLSARNVLRSA
jgi:hypothetical protein